MPFCLCQCHFTSTAVIPLPIQLTWRAIFVEECLGEKIICIVPYIRRYVHGTWWIFIFLCSVLRATFISVVPLSNTCTHLIFINNHFFSSLLFMQGARVCCDRWMLCFVWKWKFMRCSPQWLFCESMWRDSRHDEKRARGRRRRGTTENKLSDLFKVVQKKLCTTLKWRP